MKKLFLLAVMAMMAIAVQADEEEFVVTSGDFNVVRQPGKTGRLEVDFTKAKVGNLSTMEITDQTFMDYLAANDQKVFKKWSEYQEEAIETFMERWNDAKKKVVHEGEAVVEMVGTIHHGENLGKKDAILYMFYLSQKDLPLAVQHPEIPLE